MLEHLLVDYISDVDIWLLLCVLERIVQILQECVRAGVKRSLPEALGEIRLARNVELVLLHGAYHAQQLDCDATDVKQLTWLGIVLLGDHSQRKRFQRVEEVSSEEDLAEALVLRNDDESFADVHS